MAKKPPTQVLKILSQIETIQAGGERQLMGLLDELRREVVLLLMDSKLEPIMAQSIRMALKTAVERVRVKMQDALSENQKRLFVKGIQTTDAAVTSRNVRVALPYLSDASLTTLQGYGADLITKVTDEARGAITNEINLAIMGQKPMSAVMDSIGRNLDSPSIFGTIARRTQTIFKTETSRIHNISADERMKQLTTQIPGLKKEWIHGHQGVPRPGHLDLDGVQVPADGKFTLEGANGETYHVKGPHDPVLPASESVNCRCYTVPIVPDEAGKKVMPPVVPPPPPPAPPPKVLPPPKPKPLPKPKALPPPAPPPPPQKPIQGPTHTQEELHKEPDLFYTAKAAEIDALLATATGVPPERVDTTNLDENVRRDVGAALTKMSREFKFDLKMISSPPKQPGHRGWKNTYAWVVGGKRLDFNPQYFGKGVKAEKTFANDVITGFHPDIGNSTPATAIAYHEMGHVIFGRAHVLSMPNGMNLEREVTKMKRAYEAELTRRRSKGEDVSDIYISKYASKNWSEFLAEGLSSGLLSKKPSKTALEILAWHRKNFGKVST